MNKRSASIIAVVIVVIGIALGVVAWQKTRSDIAQSAIKNGTKNGVNSQAYKLKSESGTNYPIGTPQALRFTIRDNNNRIFKNFDSSDENILTLIAIRKDRTNFKEVYASYDNQSGVFTVPNFQFETDGPYRLFGRFRTSQLKSNGDVAKTVLAPYVDVTAGSIARYSPQTTSGDKFTSSVDGYDTSIFFSGGDSPGGAPATTFSAGDDSSIAINIDKAGVPFKTLQNYKGSIGRIAAFSPSLELVTANSDPEADVNNQSGLILFSLKFPNAGLYKLYVQTEANNKVSTFDYQVTVKAAPISNVNNNRR